MATVLDKVFQGDGGCAKKPISSDAFPILDMNDQIFLYRKWLSA